MPDEKITRLDTVLQTRFEELLDSAKVLTSSAHLLLQTLLTLPTPEMRRARSSLLWACLAGSYDPESAASLAASIEVAHIATSIHRTSGLGVELWWQNLLRRDSVSGEMVMFGNFLLAKSAEFGSRTHNVDTTRLGAENLAAMTGISAMQSLSTPANLSLTATDYLDNLQMVMAPFYIFAAEGAAVLCGNDNHLRHYLRAFASAFALVHQVIKEMTYFKEELAGKHELTTTAWKRGLVTFPLVCLRTQGDDLQGERIDALITEPTPMLAYEVRALAAQPDMLAAMERQIQTLATQTRAKLQDAPVPALVDALDEIVDQALAGHLF